MLTASAFIGGGLFTSHEGTPACALALFRRRGMNYLRLRMNYLRLRMNYLRLRVWHSPVNGVSGREAARLMARRAHDLGLGLLIGLHYSDWWADPGKQYKRAAICGADWKSPRTTPALLDLAGGARPSLQVYAECAGQQAL